MPCIKPTDKTLPPTAPARSGDKVAIRRKLHKLGIKITEIPADQRLAVRVWAASLTEAEVEYVADTDRHARDEARHLGGDPRDERGRFVRLRTEVVSESEESVEVVDAEECPLCEETACARCGRCACACHCG